MSDGDSNINGDRGRQRYEAGATASMKLPEEQGQNERRREGVKNQTMTKQMTDAREQSGRPSNRKIGRGRRMTMKSCRVSGVISASASAAWRRVNNLGSGAASSWLSQLMAWRVISRWNGGMAQRHLAWRRLSAHRCWQSGSAGGNGSALGIMAIMLAAWRSALGGISVSETSVTVNQAPDGEQ